MNEVNTKCLSRTQSKNTERNQNRKISFSTTLQSHTLSPEIPVEIIPFLKKEKSYGFYLLLKAEAPGSGWIKDYPNKIQKFCKNFGITQRAFFGYLAELEKLEIAFLEKNKIRLVGWGQLSRLLNIHTKQRKKIPFSANDNFNEWVAKIINFS